MYRIYTSELIGQFIMQVRNDAAVFGLPQDYHSWTFVEHFKPFIEAVITTVGERIDAERLADDRRKEFPSASPTRMKTTQVLSAMNHDDSDCLHSDNPVPEESSDIRQQLQALNFGQSGSGVTRPGYGADGRRLSTPDQAFNRSAASPRAPCFDFIESKCERGTSCRYSHRSEDVLAFLLRGCADGSVKVTRPQSRSTTPTRVDPAPLTQVPAMEKSKSA
jgi:hypothetical protein